MTRRDARCVMDWSCLRGRSNTRDQPPLASTSTRTSATAKIKSRCQVCCQYPQTCIWCHSRRFWPSPTRSNLCPRDQSCTEGSGEGSFGDRGKRQRWKRWHGCRRAQEAETRSICAASRPLLTGVMLKHLLRNEQDTRTSCGVVLDTYIVSSQLDAVNVAKAQTQAYNDCAKEGSWSRTGTTVHLGVGGADPRTHHGRDKARRGIVAALGSHGRAEQTVDRGGVQGQALSNRQDQPVQCKATLAVETLCLHFWKRHWKRCREKESKDRDLERRWHESSEARRLCANVEISGGEGGGPELGDMESDDGEPCNPAASADVARKSLVQCFFLPRKLDGGGVQSCSAFFQPRNAARRAEAERVQNDTSSPKSFFFAGVTCAGLGPSSFQ